MAADIDRALAFMHACGADPEEFKRVEFYGGHEALLLDYELALTRIDSRTELPYDVSGHFLWVGERTRQLDGAHVDVRVADPQPDRREARPDHHAGPGGRAGRAARPGRTCRVGSRFITRHGRRPGPRRPARPRREGHGERRPGRVDLRPDARQHHRGAGGRRPGASTTWSTRSRASSRSTAALGTHPGGLHIELTGDDVTECIGGAEGCPRTHLGERYETACDPRLNRSQSLELAFLVAEMLGTLTRRGLPYLT